MSSLRSSLISPIIRALWITKPPNTSYSAAKASRRRPLYSPAPFSGVIEDAVVTHAIPAGDATRRRHQRIVCQKASYDVAVSSRIYPSSARVVPARRPCSTNISSMLLSRVSARLLPQQSDYYAHNIKSSLAFAHILLLPSRPCAVI